MLASWSKARVQLKSFLAPSLAGRVDYMLTTYRKAHDQCGHGQILVDGKPVTNFCCYLEMMRKYRRPEDFDRGTTDFNQHDFVHAVGWYLNSPVEESLAGVEVEDKSDPRRSTAETAVIRQCFALMDKRVGKRTLRRLAGSLSDAEPLVRYFAALRLAAEGVPFEFDVPECVIPSSKAPASD